MQPQYIVIGKNYCSFCALAKQLLNEHSIPFTYRDVSEVNKSDVEALEKIAGTQFATVPQIFKYKSGGGLDYIGGFTDLEKTF